METSTSSAGFPHNLEIYLENLDAFPQDHCHYKNIAIESTFSLYNILADKATKKESLEIYFNSALIVANEESAIHGYGTDKNYFYFLANPANSGDYESRIYYGYDCLVGYASKNSKRGYICPSMIIELREDGKRVDTGQRLLRLLRTRCVNPEIHAIIYDTHADSIYLIKKSFLASMTKKNRYTLCNLPFRYDDAIKE